MTHSWEIGTLAEALTEDEWARLAVFAPESAPPRGELLKNEAADVLSIAERCACFSFPSWNRVELCIDAARLWLYVGSSRKSRVVLSHSSMVTVQ